MMRGWAAALASLALASCSLWPFHHDRPPAPQGPIYSPNGEPLSGGPLGDPSCEVAPGRWFDRVDARHDGAITRDQYLADASRQFTAMDIEKTGIVNPSSLAQYRAPYLAGLSRGQDQDDDSEHSRSRRDSADSGDARLAQDRPDPVMMADVGFQNHVTRDEFMAYEAQNFASLAGDDGHLHRDGVLTLCKTK